MKTQVTQERANSIVCYIHIWLKMFYEYGPWSLIVFLPFYCYFTCLLNVKYNLVCFLKTVKNYILNVQFIPNLVI